MKDKITIFLVGLLLGAIISTGSIYIYTIASNSNNNELNMQMPNDKGQGGIMEEGGNNPPKMPNNEQNTNQSSN